MKTRILLEAEKPVTEKLKPVWSRFSGALEEKIFQEEVKAITQQKVKYLIKVR